MRLLSCALGLETLGQNIHAFSDNLQAAETYPIMQRYGIDQVAPNDWYPTHKLLSALNELMVYPNVSANFIAIGMEIARIVPLPPSLVDPTPGAVMMIWDDLYQAVHRGGDAGRIQCEQVRERHYRAILTDLYPDDFNHGIVYGFAQRFLHPGIGFRVYYEADIPTRDRHGASTTIIHLNWD